MRCIELGQQRYRQKNYWSGTRIHGLNSPWVANLRIPSLVNILGMVQRRAKLEPEPFFTSLAVCEPILFDSKRESCKDGLTRYEKAQGWVPRYGLVTTIKPVRKLR